MVKKVLFKKGDPAWKGLRSRYVTATDLPTLFGFAERSTPSAVYKKKTNPEPFGDNVFTRMGRILEDSVKNIAEEKLSIEVNSFGERADMVYFSETLRMSATPDSYIGVDQDNIKALVELKSTSLKNLIKWSQSPPLHYLTQLAAQCLLLDVREGYLTIMHPRYPDLPSLIYKATFDLPKLKDLAKSEVQRFWTHFETSRGYMKIDDAKADQFRRLLLESLERVHYDKQEVWPLQLEVKQETGWIQ